MSVSEVAKPPAYSEASSPLDTLSSMYGKGFRGSICREVPPGICTYIHVRGTQTPLSCAEAHGEAVPYGSPFVTTVACHPG